MKKRFLPLTALLVLLALLAGCAGGTVPPAQEPAPLPASPAEAAEPAENEEPGPAGDENETPFVPGEEIREEEPAPAVEEIKLEPEETDLRVETDETVLDGRVGTVSGVPNGRLPQVLMACEDRQAVNNDIMDRFGYLIGADYCRLNYEAYIGAEGCILSVVVVTEYDESRFYMPYSINLLTGKWIKGSELLTYLCVDRMELAEAELGIMGGEFVSQFGSLQGQVDEAVYDEQLGRTTSPENAEYERVWLGAGGQLMFAAKIYSLAGAEFYEYPMSAGYLFP